MIQRLSDYLEIDPAGLRENGAFDSFIGIDALLFLDPHLLKNTSIPEFTGSDENIRRYFNELMTLLVASSGKGDKAWREAHKRLIFREMPGVAIGYGTSDHSGSGVGPKLARELLESAQEIIKMGIREPEIFALLGLFEEGFGADRLSDMTIRIIRKDIFAYTERVSKSLNIKKVGEFSWGSERWTLPKRNNKPLLLLPEEFLRDLPVALSWDEIWKVASLNQELRNRLNAMIGVIWNGNRKAPKSYIKKVILGNADNVKALVEAYKKSDAKPYDFDRDAKGQVKWSQFGLKYASENPLTLSLEPNPSADQIEEVVLKIVQQFKRNIEVNGLKEHLYIKHGQTYKPLHERYSQLLFYAAADTYCTANNLDLSREPNAGNGPVDFKVSRGYEGRILVEIKLTSNKNLLSGLTEQLSAYEESENTRKSVYLIIRVTESDNSIKQLQKLETTLRSEGKSLPRIVYVDARIKPSASKRRRLIKNQIK